MKSATSIRRFASRFLVAIGAISMVSMLLSAFPSRPAPSPEEHATIHVPTPLDLAVLRADPRWHQHRIRPESEFREGPRLTSVIFSAGGEFTEKGWWIERREVYAQIDLPPDIAEATVSVMEPTGLVACPREGNRFHCSNRVWNRVGAEEITVDGRRETCIWAHPEQRPLHVRWDRFPSDRHHGFALETALDDRAIGTRVPVQVDVIRDESRVTHRHPDRRGWTSVSLPSSESASALELVITTSNPGRRHFCFRIIPEHLP